MDTNQILAIVVAALQTVVSGGAGAGFIFGVIELLGQYIPLSGTQKRNLAPALALVLPPAAYGLLLWLTGAQFAPAVLCMSVFIGYVGATRIHDTLEAKQKADQTNSPVDVPATAGN